MVETFYNLGRIFCPPSVNKADTAITAIRCSRHKSRNFPLIALLTDMHAKPYKKVILSLRKHQPKLICIAGDIMYGNHPEDDTSPLDTQDNVLPFLRACADIAPTFLSLGNHEWMLDSSDLKRISETGITILDNDIITIDTLRSDTNIHRSSDDTAMSAGKLVIAGLTSAYVSDYRSFKASLPEAQKTMRYPKMDLLAGIDGIRIAADHRPDTQWLKQFSAIPGYHILLCHHPEYIDLIPKDVELVLSGHAHGGQCRLFGHGLFAPGQGFFPRYSSGIYNGRLIVSRGLSNTVKVPRLFNPTQIIYLVQGTDSVS